MSDDQRTRRADNAIAVVRRAPFSDNPLVGARGQRTQQRILDAALRMFGDEGFHGCSVDRIAKVARCSRVSFYQYFASKEEVFQHLAGQVARQLSASTEALDPLTPDRRGWEALRAWVGRYAEIYTRYEPVFHAYESDAALGALAARTGEATIARFHSRLVTTTPPPRQLDAVIRLLLACLNHTFGVTGILRSGARSVAPDAYKADRVEDAVADVLHRTLFGGRIDVNMRLPNGAPPPALEFSPAMFDVFQEDDAIRPSASRNRALAALLESGRAVFVDRGYHGTRVDDLAAAAGVSHGAFYRYFRNKDQLARILTARAMQSVWTTAIEIPDLFADGSEGPAALRRWLRRYHVAHANEAAMLRVWVDGALQDPTLRSESAPPLDWGRRRMARYLQPRGFGDVDMDAVILVALLGVVGAQERQADKVEAAAQLIERGLLGR